MNQLTSFPEISLCRVRISSTSFPEISLCRVRISNFFRREKGVHVLVEKKMQGCRLRFFATLDPHAAKLCQSLHKSWLPIMDHKAEHHYFGDNL